MKVGASLPSISCANKGVAGTGMSAETWRKKSKRRMFLLGDYSKKIDTSRFYYFEIGIIAPCKGKCVKLHECTLEGEK